MTIITKVRNWWIGRDPVQEQQQIKLVSERMSRLCAESRTKQQSSGAKPIQQSLHAKAKEPRPAEVLHAGRA